MARLIDGKQISKQIKDELKEEVCKMKEQGTKICLAVIQVGEDAASSVYVNNKKKACAYIGIDSRAYELPENTSEEDLVALVEELNSDETVNGILVQLPLPSQINEDRIIRTISPDKDVDGFHPVSVGRLWLGEKGFVSCERRGKTNYYAPLVSRDAYQAFESASVLNKVFGSSLKSFVASLARGGELKQEELDEVQAYLEQLKRGEES